jgi:hypothetical protein
MSIIYEIMNDYGISELDAKIIKGYSDKNKTTIEEEFNRRLKEGLLTLGGNEKDSIVERKEEELEDEFDSL